MTQTFAENENNDTFLDANGNIALFSGIVALAQLCTDAMEAQIGLNPQQPQEGEMPLATNRGVPTMAAIWLSFQPAQFEVAARNLLNSISDVTGVVQFNITRLNGVASYVAKINTIYGPTTITGDLST